MTYDKIADVYDDYHPAWYEAEDAETARLTTVRGKVLDIGCGTGEAIKLLGLEPETYFGMDLSEEMIRIAKSRFPEHSFIRADARKMGSLGRYQTILLLFGSASYLRPGDLHAILVDNIADDGAAFFHLYGKGRDWKSPTARMDVEKKLTLWTNDVDFSLPGFWLAYHHMNPWNFTPRVVRGFLAKRFNPGRLSPSRYAWTYYAARRNRTTDTRG